MAVYSEFPWNALPFRVEPGGWLSLELPLTRSSSLRARSPEARISEVRVGAQHPQARRGQASGLCGGAEGVQHLRPLPDLADHADPDPAADTHRLAGPGLSWLRVSQRCGWGLWISSGIREGGHV